MIRPIRLVLALVLGSSAGLAAQWFVPGVVSSAREDGSRQVTELRLSNAGTSTADVRIDVITYEGEAAPQQTVLTLAPRQTYSSADLFQSLWELGEGRGTLRIDSEQPLAITAARAGAGSRAALPVFSGYELLDPERTGHALGLASTESAAGRIEAFLATPSTEADLIAYDATGAEINRLHLSGGPSTVRIDADALVSDLPVGRLELQVAAGRIAATYLSTDRRNGHEFLTPFIAEPGAQKTYVAPLVRRRDGTAARSDVRILSLAGQVVFVSRLPAGPERPPYVIVKAAETLEIRDVLGSVAGVTEDTIANVRFYSVEPFILEVRNVTTTEQGETGEMVSPARSEPGVWILPGAGREDRLLLAGGADATSLNLDARDADGQVVASAAEVPLDADGIAEQTVSSLFPGVDLPEEVTLEATPISGTVELSVSRIEPDTGDWSSQNATPLSVAAFCPVPDITSFSADPPALAAAGESTLFWNVSGAGSIRLYPDGNDVPQDGSAKLTLTQSATYRLEASNPCGTVEQTVTIPFGAPRISGVTPAQARPGDIVTVTVENLADAQTVTGINLAIPGSPIRLMNLLGTGSTTTLQFVAPLAKRYATGTIAIDIDGAASASAPFTLLAPTYAGDAVADMKALITDIARWLNERRAEIAALPDTTEYVRLVQPAIDRDANELLRALDQVASTGRATLPIDAPSVKYPKPDEFTVTRADIEAIMATIRALAPAPAASSAVKNLDRFAATGGEWALSRNGQYAACLKELRAEYNGLVNRSMIDQMWTGVTSTVDVFVDVVAGVTLPPPVVWTAKMSKLASRLDLYCKVYPMNLRSFRARSLPNPIPFLGLLEKSRDSPPVQNLGTELYARFEPIWNRDQAAQALLREFENQALQALQREIASLPEKRRDEAAKKIRDFAERLHQSGVEEARKVLSNIKVDPAASERLVYKDDITSVAPETARPQLLGYDAAREPETPDPVYGFEGNSRYRWLGGGSGRIAVSPKESSFIDTDTVYANFKYKRQTKVYYAPVLIGQTSRSVSVGGSLGSANRAQAITLETRPFAPRDGALTRSISNSGTPLDPGLGSGLCAIENCYQRESAKFSAQYIDRNTIRLSAQSSLAGHWSVEGGFTRAGTGVTLIHSRSASKRHRLHITASVTATTDPDQYAIFGRGATASCSISVTGGESKQLFITSGSQTLDVPGWEYASCGVSSNGARAGQASAQMTIQMIEK